MTKLEELMDRVENDFKFHPATEVTGPFHDAIRNELLQTATFIVSHTPAGREQSLALTKLEEAMFWANAAIARAG